MGKKATSRKTLEQEKLSLRREVERLSGEGRHADAIVLLKRLAEMSPRNPLIWNDLGVEYAAMGDLDEAIAALRQGRAVYTPAFAPILSNLGKFLLQRFLQDSNAISDTGAGSESLSEAIRLLNASLDRDPENLEAHALLAVAQERAGRKDIAAAHLRIVESMSGSGVSFE
ncbi:MAG TPA: tetratricopeptide repeat protein [Edaphobacter sp.]|jgi:Flp pilus assembly protein TadD|nr:tetratricopeptide repeat protein [Edaphobacter sp.]